MKRLSYFGLILAILIAALPGVAAASAGSGNPTPSGQTREMKVLEVTPANVAGSPLVVQLYAGQHTDIGEVQIWDNGTTLYVKYVVDVPGWCLTETHLYVGATPPNKMAPGQFPYKMDHDPCVTDYTYMVPLPAGSPLYIATHAVSQYCEGGEGLPLGFEPYDTCWNAYFTGGGDVAYFDVDGQPGWCADANQSFGGGTCGTAYSLYDPQALAKLDIYGTPTCIGGVNYLLNNQAALIGTNPTGEGVITVGDFQGALWRLLDDDPPGNWAYDLGGLTMTENPEDVYPNVEYLVTLANANCQYVPGCGERQGVLLWPGDGESQPLLIDVPVRCGECYDETAWGLGGPNWVRPEKNWSQYFQYTPGVPN